MCNDATARSRANDVNEHQKDKMINNAFRRVRIFYCRVQLGNVTSLETALRIEVVACVAAVGNIKK